MLYTIEHYTLMNARRRAAWVRERRTIDRIVSSEDGCGMSPEFVDTLRRQASMIDRRLSVQ